MPNPYYSVADLPETLPVFPLTGVPLFPRWQLPLNIFEPRYLNMIDDAMLGKRLIGMVQSFGGSREIPTLAKVGCVGRITNYSETDDGRYMITLTGIARYRIDEELDVKTPYRQVRANYADYASDLKDPDLENVPPRLRLEAALQVYIDKNGFDADWGAVQDAQIETLVHALATGCPFRPIEKQALIEAEDLKARSETLIKLFSMSVNDLDTDPDTGPLQ